MLRGLLSRFTRGGAARRRPAGRPMGGGAGAAGANREIEHGARSLLRGLSRKRRI